MNWNLTNNSANWNTWAKAIFTRENKLLSGPAPVKMAGMPINGYLFIMRLPQVVVTFQNAYTVNQMLVDYNDIRKGPVARLEQPVLKPGLANEEKVK